jgi:RND family efflux transporter MFP subunit
VAKINYDEGETVVPGSPVIVVVNYTKSWVNAQIDEIDIANVRMGDKVKITSDVYPDKVYEGQIYWIAPVAELRKVGGRVKMDEESYVFPCKIRMLNDHSELKVNMSVNVDISTKQNDNALLVPREALISKDDSSFVYVINRNRARERKILIGIRSYTSIEATSGLVEGELVAITNVSKLKDKGRVKIEQ